jgi:hypothetical protein
MAPLPQNAKAPYMLVRTHGIAAWLEVGAGPIKALHTALGYLWVVSGYELYRVDSNLTATFIGTVGASSRVDIDHNVFTIVVVSEPNGFYYDTASSTFGPITDTDFTSRGAGDVEFIDNFMLFREPSTGRFFASDVGSATAYDGLNFATAEGAPDNLVGLKVDHREALLFGDSSIEIWELVGGAGFPFARSANGFIEIGCANGGTIAKLDNTVFWLAPDNTVRRLDGVTPIRVSQDGIEQALASMTLSSGQAFSCSLEGQLYYVLSFLEGTFVYNVTTKQWHEQKTYGFNYWLAGSYAQFSGLDLVGDVSSNRIGRLSTAAYQDWDLIQRMEWTYQPVYADSNTVFHDRLDVICEAGVGTTLGQGVDPQMMMDVSDDGGETWEALPSTSMGAIGNFRRTVSWGQLGSAEDRVYRGAVSDPVRVNIIDTQLTARGARVFGRAA